MKIPCFAVITFLCLFFFLAGCQTLPFPAQNGTVSSENRVTISDGKQSGSWRGNDLTVDYACTRTGADLDITGTVRFAEHMSMGFSLLRDFRLSAILTDENGRVLETKGVTTDRGKIGPIPFRVRFAVPVAATSMAFSYSGVAVEAGGEDGGGGFTHFWQYPVAH